MTGSLKQFAELEHALVLPLGTGTRQSIVLLRRHSRVAAEQAGMIEGLRQPGADGNGIATGTGDGQATCSCL